jgi:GNAT superfamily N-acetyltransferase
MIPVRRKREEDAAWIREVLVRFWGGPQIVAGAGRVVDASGIPALVAGDHEGLATYAISSDGRSAELITLNALTPGCGVGTALLAALMTVLESVGSAELQVSTSNDNLDALRFYQRRGFRLAGLAPGAIDGARRLKPGIPLIGRYGIAIRDRIDLVRDLAAR